MIGYKPANYNSLSAYLIVDDAQKLTDLLTIISDARPLRRFDRENGKSAHSELLIDDTVIMISDSLEDYPATKTMLHLYVPGVFKTIDLAVAHGCELIEKSVQRHGDPDIRGAFYDCAGNYWAVSTQINPSAA